MAAVVTWLHPFSPFYFGMGASIVEASVAFGIVCFGQGEDAKARYVDPWTPMRSRTAPRRKKDDLLLWPLL